MINWWFKVLHRLHEIGSLISSWSKFYFEIFRFNTIQNRFLVQINCIDVTAKAFVNNHQLQKMLRIHPSPSVLAPYWLLIHSMHPSCHYCHAHPPQYVLHFYTPPYHTPRAPLHHMPHPFLTLSPYPMLSPPSSYSHLLAWLGLATSWQLLLWLWLREAGKK